MIAAVRNPLSRVQWLLIPAILVFAIAFQGSRGLWEPDEGRYTDIATQMLRSGDFLTPAFNDESPHFAKPPLTYWAIAGGISLLGWNEWGARLANALAYAGTILALLAIAKRITPARPWLPPLAYASFLLPFGASNIVTTDTLLALWEALGVLGFVLLRERREKESRHLACFLMWGGFGLAFLTKGPPGLLPLAVIAVFIVLVEGWRRLAVLSSAGGLLLFAVIGFGWYALVAASQPHLLDYFLRQEVVGRIATHAAYNRNSEWYGAFLVYLPTLAVGSLPWSFSLIRRFRALYRSVLARRWWKEKISKDPWAPFLVLWLFVPLLVFGVSRSRLPLYLLPLFLPLALITGRVVSFRFSRLGTCLIVFWLIALLGLKWGASKYPYPRDVRPLAHDIAAVASTPPSEILFVETDPLWGLRLYLKCEVEQVGAGPSRSVPAPNRETLAQELSSGEPGTLIMVPKKEKARIEHLLNQMGYQGKEIAEIRSWSLIAPLPAIVRESPPLV